MSKTITGKGLFDPIDPNQSATTVQAKEPVQQPIEGNTDKPKGEINKTKKNPKGAGRKRLCPKGNEPVKVSFSGPKELFEDVKKAFLYTPGNISTKILEHLDEFFKNPVEFYKNIEKPFEVYDYSNVKSSGFSAQQDVKDRIAEVCRESGISQKQLLNSIYYQMLLDIKKEKGEL